MIQCIYCKKEEIGKFKGKEHVIPQSFGKFSSKTPTLKCVCDECNAYFSKELDLLLARDTLEGVMRAKKGLTSQTKTLPKSVKFSLAETLENGEFGGALIGGPHPVTGEQTPLLPQFWIKNIENGEWEKYRLEEIRNIVITDKKYGPATIERKMKVIGPSREKYDAILAELKKYNIPFRMTDMLKEIPFLKNIDPDGKVMLDGAIEGKIGNQHKRAFAKVLFNFATHYLGKKETTKSQWDRVRQFIRYSSGTLLWRISQKPFWDGQEKDNFRYQSDSYNLRVENQNRNVVGVIQIYNLLTYEIVLVENYEIKPEQEVAYRFTPGKEPHRGIKMPKPAWS